MRLPRGMLFAIKNGNDVEMYELITCDDCRHYRPETEECAAWDLLRTKADGYCHKAELRGDMGGTDK